VADVFITYSSDAKKLAERLASALQKEGVATWADFENLSVGEPWFEQVEHALDGAKFYIFILGPRNEVGAFQDREWQSMVERTWSDPEKRVIPILAGRAESPPFLQDWVAVRHQPGDRETDLVKKLVKMIKTSSPVRARRRTGPDKDWLDRLRLIEDAAKRWKAEEAPAPKREA
jgi:hypothetical protein